MAPSPPQTAAPRRPFRRAHRLYLSAPTRHLLAIAVIGALWPLRAAHAQRTCEQWSADITAVEGHVEVLRDEERDWVALSTGERVCSGDALRSESSSRATLTLPDGGTIRLDENSAMALPEPRSGFGSLIELLRGVIHIISRDPRELQFTTPYANAGLEGTEFDIRVDETNRWTEIVVLEGEVVVTTPAGQLNVASDHIAIAKDGEAPTASPYSTPIERMRWASHYPRDRRSPAARSGSRAAPRRSKQTRTSTRTAPPHAWLPPESKPRKPISQARCKSLRGTRRHFRSAPCSRSRAPIATARASCWPTHSPPSRARSWRELRCRTSSNGRWR